MVEAQASEPPRDAQIQIEVSEDHMKAVLHMLPPENGGEDVTVERIRAALTASGVTAGILEPIVCMAARAKGYGKAFTVAKGLVALHGEDGAVEDCFARETKIRPQAGEDGRMDYKNLNMVREVREGAVICHIRRETPSRDGKTVLGEVLQASVGCPIQIPVGRNTAVSEDGTQLLAACGGNLIFEGGQFHVEKVLRIFGDVDNAVGNLRFSGDVDIGGDVREGFEIYSGGSISVRGTVEGAYIEAQGDITLTKGMNGMSRGRLRAGGDIYCQFIENADVRAGKCVYGDMIRGCKTVAGDKVLLQGKHGLLAGGACTARNGIEALCIGSPTSSVPMEVTLGTDSAAVETLKGLERRAAWLTAQLEVVNRDLAYLNRVVTQGELSPVRQERLEERTARRAEFQQELDSISAELRELEAEVSKPQQGGRLAGREIHPPLKVTIGSQTFTVTEKQTDRFFYCMDGQIRRGTMV